MAKRALSKKFTMCQYAVLASLMQQPRSGYDIAQWFAHVTQHFWAIGHSSIYPALADLEKRVFVEYAEEPSEQGPTRKVYHLTSAGRDALLTWVDSPAADAEVRDEQLLKALCYGFLQPQRAIEMLSLARARHVERKAYYEQLVRAAEEDMKVDDPHKSAAALGRKLTARRGVGVQASYIEWCDEAIAAIQPAASVIGGSTHNAPCITKRAVQSTNADPPV